MPLDPSLDELASEQRRSMTHELEPPNPVRNFIDYAQQPAPPRPPLPGEERINQAITKQFPGYVPSQPQPQQNWQRWGEEALTNLPFGFMGALRMSRMTPGNVKNSWWGSEHNFDLMHKETGQLKGELYTNYNRANNDLKIEFLGSEGFGEKRFWGIGTHELESLGPELLREFPDIKTISFSRPRHGLYLQYQVTRTPEGGVEMNRIKTIKTRSGEIGRAIIGGGAFGPSQPPSAAPSTPPSPLRPAPPAAPTPVEPRAPGVVGTPFPDYDPGWRTRGAPPEPTPPAEEQFWREAEERQRQNAEWNASLERLFGSLIGR